MPTTYYHSEEVHWSNEPRDDGQHFGQRNIVDIKNSKGTKVVERLDKSGKSMGVEKKMLNSDEMKRILNRQFVPGLFDGFPSRLIANNIRRKNNTRNATKKSKSANKKTRRRAPLNKNIK